LTIEEGRRRRRRRATRAAHLETEKEIEEEEEEAVAIPAVVPPVAASLPPAEARSEALSRPTTQAVKPVKPSRYAGQKLLYMVRILILSTKVTTAPL
jgi:hypothetical protein